MCRHLAYLGPPVPLSRLLTEVPNGLYEQSWAPRRQRYGTVNADGFGVGWYPAGQGERPARYRRAVPIWADGNLPDLARAVTSHAVLAAVRDATPGTSQDEGAAAPFAAGPWLFSHNGAVPGWQTLPDDLGPRPSAADLLGMEARCDSALLWTLARPRLTAGEPPGDVLADLAVRTAAARPGARLNLLLTDGRTIAATRLGDSLWYRADADGVVVASEPDASTGWREVPDASLLLAAPDAVRTTPLPPVRPAPAPASAPLPASGRPAPAPPTPPERTRAS
ncbi:ergothioneine biosynthesis protein EgtC [Streptomyces sp. TRM 70351]|uniref:ergothioneine biosynthesis protein EgtC n=1 Tax=Streptomyces sp. TRM 70351 TaxID=3116552 RepID=UPI002E7BCCD6|nr:ergothioneine biosynthesis protein EgtC [Streptomyces sp. TRM 70351]MEE1930343.1 ergothioneine biosynthesis protein EgtC [Streptomyces sp. TRM 70351]